MTGSTISSLVEAALAADSDQARADAVRSAACADIESALHGSLDSGTATQNLFTTGIAASPGAASGQAYFTADDAMEGFNRGENVVLVCTETTPADEPVMRIAEGIVTARGGLASHAAVMARGWGIPAVCGAETIDVGRQVAACSVTGVSVTPGTHVTLDGASGEVFVGEATVTESAGGLSEEVATLLGWADQVCADAGALRVRANADSGDDAAVARQFGAQGIGLCRTEHQFLGERASLIANLITGQGDDGLLDHLFELQRADFGSVLDAMDGLPVTVRLLDAPLHEFLGEDPPGEWHEANPMLGFRGVRVGLLRPAVYASQARALAAAVKDRRAAGGNPQPEIMIPLVAAAAELEAARATVLTAWNSELPDDQPRVGTMVETPRAALTAGELVAHTDFFSFGTNDLTQLTFGFSRDDLEARVIQPYVTAGHLAVSPFASLDTDGVGALVTGAVAAARAAAPDVSIGVCGEHGGDPDSIGFFHRAGLSYVSCSPYRVPAARLAAAQAVLAE